MIENFSFDRKEYFLIFCTLFFLISLNFFLASEYRDGLLSVLWVGDDVFHINIADSFRTDKTFSLNYISTGYIKYSAEDFLNKVEPFPSPQASKGPIYYILLGTVF